MPVFGIFIGALLLVIGLLIYWLAPRVGPNPFFGVRIGYSFASRDVWDRTNRAGGVLIAATGLGVILLALVLRLLLVPDAAAITIITGALLVALSIGTVWLGFYSRRLAQATALTRDIAPVKFRWTYFAPVLATFALLAAVAAYFYPLLPPDRLATHFDFDGQPNDWMSRDALYLFFGGLSVFFIFLNALLVVIATKEPLIAFERWGSRWRLEPPRGLVYTGVALGLGNLILAYSILDIGWFSTRGAHFIPIATFLWLILLISPALLALFFILGRRAPPASKDS